MLVVTLLVGSVVVVTLSTLPTLPTLPTLRSVADACERRWRSTRFSLRNGDNNRAGFESRRRRRTRGVSVTIVSATMLRELPDAAAAARTASDIGRRCRSILVDPTDGMGKASNS